MITNSQIVFHFILLNNIIKPNQPSYYCQIKSKFLKITYFQLNWLSNLVFITDKLLNNYNTYFLIFCLWYYYMSNVVRPERLKLCKHGNFGIIKNFTSVTGLFLTWKWNMTINNTWKYQLLIYNLILDV